MNRRVLVACVAAVIAAVVTGGCGSEGPTGSSAAGGVGVQGVVLGNGASVSAADTQTSSSGAKKVTVKVEGTSLTVDVSASGTFQFTGIPSGTFTLVFLADGVEIGRVVVSAADGSEVKIVVQVTAGTLVVVEIKVESPTSAPSPGATPATSSSCMVNGGTQGQGIELEGDVFSGSSAGFKITVNGRSSVPVDVNTSGASFRCIGSAKTTSDAECKASVKPGAKVHVSGTLTSCSSSAALVTAAEVKVQKD
jgi:hypothetical protein